MGKGLYALVLIALVVASAIAAVMLSAPEKLGKDDVAEIIRERYNPKNASMEYDEDCGIPGGCWKARMEFPERNPPEIRNVIVNPYTGEVEEEKAGECNEWWCNASSCSYVQKAGNSTIYNSGCSNPQPACDADYNMCRGCSSPSECIRKTVTETINDTLYKYETISTEGYAVYNESNATCRVFQGNDMLVENQTTVEECRDVLLFYTRCGSDGACAFSPVFGLVPY